MSNMLLNSMVGEIERKKKGKRGREQEHGRENGIKYS